MTEDPIATNLADVVNGDFDRAMYMLSPLHAPFMSSLIPWAFPDKPWMPRFDLFPRWTAFWRRLKGVFHG